MFSHMMTRYSKICIRHQLRSSLYIPCCCRVAVCYYTEMADVQSNRADIRSALSNRGGWRSLIVFFVLTLAWLAGFSARLFAVIRFESIIHEFDPWSVPNGTYASQHGNLYSAVRTHMNCCNSASYFKE